MFLTSAEFIRQARQAFWFGSYELFNSKAWTHLWSLTHQQHTAEHTAVPPQTPAGLAAAVAAGVGLLVVHWRRKRRAAAAPLEGVGSSLGALVVRHFDSANCFAA